MSKIEIIPMQIKEHIYHIDIYSYDDSLKETSIDLTPVLNKCKADASLLSFILVNKYLYHLPIERQLKILEEAGLMYTLIESCKLNNIRPKVYIEEMLRKLVDDKDQDIKALLP